MKRVLCAMFALIILLTLAACQPEDTNPTADNRPTEAPDLSYYNTYLTADPTSVDISRISDAYSSTLVKNVMESLVRMGEVNGNYKILPGDALTWGVNADSTVWTFHLGNNTWSDGVAVTAQDYVYSLQRSADPATDCPNEYFLLPIAGYQDVRNGAPPERLGVEALDDKTLQITLSYPVPSFLEMACDTIYYPQRRDIVEKYGDLYGTSPAYSVFNGAYTMESWIPGEKIVLSRRESYWDADSVLIEQVNVHILSDSAEACAMYEAGALDHVSTSDGEWVQKLQSRADTAYIRTYSAKVNFVLYNIADALFQNVNIRRAFSLAVDREALNHTIYGGNSNPATGWVTGAMAVGSQNYRDYAGDMIRMLHEDAAAEGKTARDYLLLGMEELGLGEDPAALDITFSLAGTDEWFQNLGQYLQEVYRTSLGVELKISYNNWNDFSTQLNDGTYQVCYMSWEAYYNDPCDVLSLFLSTNETINSGWSNGEFDALVLQAQSEMDEDKRLALYKQAEQLMLLDACVVNPIVFTAANNFYKNHVQGYPTLAFSSGVYKEIDTSGRQ